MCDLAGAQGTCLKLSRTSMGFLSSGSVKGFVKESW